MTREPHKLLSADPTYRDTLLGPTLREATQNAAVWDPHELPKHPHRRRDCSSESRALRTKRPAAVCVTYTNPTTGEVTTYGTEVCRCGSHRPLINGEPSGKWVDVNAALKNPNWFTRSDRYDHHGDPARGRPDGAAPGYPVVRATEQPVAQPTGKPQGWRGRARIISRTWP